MDNSNLPQDPHPEIKGWSKDPVQQKKIETHLSEFYGRHGLKCVEQKVEYLELYLGGENTQFSYSVTLRDKQTGESIGIKRVSEEMKLASLLYEYLASQQLITLDLA